MTMNVNSRKLLVDNKNRYKLNTKDLVVSIASLIMFGVLIRYYTLPPPPPPFFLVILPLSRFLPCFIHKIFSLFVPPFQLSSFHSFILPLSVVLSCYFNYSFFAFNHNFIKLIFIISAECKCPPYAQCQRDENNFKKYKCVCPPTRTADKRKVCGSNGRTYINRNVLEKESCLTDIKITVLYAGVCSKFKPIQLLVFNL